MNYHGQIMNLGANCTHAGSPREDAMSAYMEGHKRARHDAAEIANEADAEIERLTERCEAMQLVALKFFEVLAKADPEGAKRFADSLPNAT